MTAGVRICDAVVIGAGAVGAATAYFASKAGLSVIVLERGSLLEGSSSACEGNLLVSDKEAGPELTLAQYSQGVWRDDLAEYRDVWEFESKGGLVVAMTEAGNSALEQLAVRQRAAGIDVRHVDSQELRSHEPLLSGDAVAGAFYPQDCQVQPMLLVAHLLRLARQHGARVHYGTSVLGFHTDGGRITGVRTNRGSVYAEVVVNAAGTAAGDVADMAKVRVPVLPRRGFVLVTAPLPPATVRHKVYAAEYVASTQSSEEGLQTSAVVEGTKSGTVLIGSSRERVGFDSTVSLRVLKAVAQNAVALFPSLASMSLIRTYFGFRPYCPDHLPVIGLDARVPGLAHATGHEGAGIGLSVGTGKLLVQALTQKKPDIDISRFAPERFG